MFRLIAFLGILASGAAIIRGQTASPVGSSDGFVQVDGGRLYYQECGNGPEAVLLLHDGVVNSAIWNGVWEDFCREFHTIRYDRRGYGRSPETTKPYYEADDVAVLLRNRKVTHGALVASSHGGGVALNFAVRYPAQVSDLVLIGPAPNGFPYSEAFIESQMPFQDEKNAVKVRVESNYLIAPGHEAAREELRKLLEASPQDHRHNDMPLPEKPVFPYLANLHVPVLILCGSADIADNQAVAGALQMAIPGAQRVVVPDSGHLLYLEKPKEFFSIVREFLRTHDFLPDQR